MKTIAIGLATTLAVTSLSATEIPPIKETPGGPPNKPASVIPGKDKKSFILRYGEKPLLQAKSARSFSVNSSVAGNPAITQTIKLTNADGNPLKFTVLADSSAMASETKGAAQKRFPLVRTSHGLSNNLRNNAIYDRDADWMLEFPEGSIIKGKTTKNGIRFNVTVSSENPTVIFRPRFYQKHKNIPYFEPWTYKVRKDSITGWSSWWAYFRNCTQNDVNAVLDVWKEKHFDDFGYRFIQLDDAFQGEKDRHRNHVPHSINRDYIGGSPDTWLEWRKDKYPGGLEDYVRQIKKRGFEPAIWIGCHFTDVDFVKQHPEYFVRDKDGKPTVGRWVSYVFDATNPVVADKLIRPTFRGLKEAGITYVKIDLLRHMLYDNLNNNKDYLLANGTRPDDILRAYLKIAREEMGKDGFILACWGVLPEVVGIADACRIAGDGFGPASMQQYNSWNGIVWRNDPDHCDVSPKKSAVDKGNVTKTQTIKSIDNETLIRPALASLSGSLLILSDRPDVYKNDANLEGVKRSSPVLFSVPGQLYDFDPSRTDRVKTLSRLDIKTGERPTPIDAAQFGFVNPFWLNEFNTVAGNWNVLHRLNWDKKKTAPETTVKFADLGLDPSKEYLVYEFWTKKFYGVLRNQFTLAEQGPMGISSYAIREKLAHPQLVSTSRHFSQGAAEITEMKWKGRILSGKSKVVTEDPYTITLTVPKGFKLRSFSVNGKKIDFKVSDHIATATYTPQKTETITWKAVF